MAIALVSVGTRGGVEPFLAAADLLSRRGHQVACAFPEQYLHLATEGGYAGVGLDRRFLELVEGAEGSAFMGGRDHR